MNKPWTPDEDRLLTRILDLSNTNVVACTRFREISRVWRSRNAVFARIHTLGISKGASIWKPHRVSALKKMWEQGKTASQIAKALGDGITRSSVIGKAHRLGLSKRASPIKRYPKKTWREYAPHLIGGSPPKICDWPDGCNNLREGRTAYCEFHNKRASAGKPKKTGGEFRLPGLPTAMPKAWL